MKILLAASDLTSLLPTGSEGPLGVLANLALAFQRAGHEVSLAGPFIPALEQSGTLKLKPTGVQISVPLGGEKHTASVAEAHTEDGLQLFLFRHDTIFGNLPAPGPGAALMDAPAAALFSKLLAELARRLNPAPDVIQIQDWPGALCPLLLKTQHLPFTSVLALEDPASHGSFPIEDFHLLNLGWEHFRPTGVEFYGRLDFLKSGIVAAPAIVAPGELEREALQTSEYGGGLDAVLRENADRLHGIPYGLDEQTWNPAKDPLLGKRYTPSNLSGKFTGRNVLLSQLDLAKNPSGPVFLLDLSVAQDRFLLEALGTRLDGLLATDTRLMVFAGAGAKVPIPLSFEIAARKHIGRLALVREVDDRIRHLGIAGADFHIVLGSDLHTTDILLRGLKYGTLPISPASSGLRQVAEDYQPGTEIGFGLTFYQRTADALFDALAHRAAGLLENADAWESLRQRAMIHAGKFTWARTAAQYVALYGRLVR